MKTYCSIYSKQKGHSLTLSKPQLAFSSNTLQMLTAMLFFMLKFINVSFFSVTLVNFVLNALFCYSCIVRSGTELYFFKVAIMR